MGRPLSDGERAFAGVGAVLGVISLRGAGRPTPQKATAAHPTLPEAIPEEQLSRVRGGVPGGGGTPPASSLARERAIKAIQDIELKQLNSSNSFTVELSEDLMNKAAVQAEDIRKRHARFGMQQLVKAPSTPPAMRDAVKNAIKSNKSTVTDYAWHHSVIDPTKLMLIPESIHTQIHQLERYGGLFLLRN